MRTCVVPPGLVSFSTRTRHLRAGLSYSAPAGLDLAHFVPPSRLRPGSHAHTPALRQVEPGGGIALPRFENRETLRQAQGRPWGTLRPLLRRLKIQHKTHNWRAFPARRARFLPSLRGLFQLMGRDPGLTSWAMLCRPFRGWVFCDFYRRPAPRDPGLTSWAMLCRPFRGWVFCESVSPPHKESGSHAHTEALAPSGAGSSVNRFHRLTKN